MDMLNVDIKVPRNHWANLTREDQATFMQLHIHFIKQQKEHMKDRKSNTFFNDIMCLLQYIEYTPLRKDDRAICVGVACSGPFMCVNTQQLKIILGRCKSSINNSFQQIGYDTVKTKGKSREAVLSIIPSLITEQNTLRKWTVRCASENAQCCFVSRYLMRTLLTDDNDDFLDDNKNFRTMHQYFVHSNKQQASPPPLIFGQNGQQMQMNMPIMLPAMNFSNPQNQNNINQQKNSQMQQQFHNNFYHHQQLQQANAFQQQNYQMNFAQSQQIFQPQNNQQNQTEIHNNINNHFNNNDNTVPNSNNNNNVSNNNNPLAVPPPPTSPTIFHDDDDDFFGNDHNNNNTSTNNYFDITPSFSLDYIADFEFDDNDNNSQAEVDNSPLEQPGLFFSFPRSQSAFLSSQFNDFNF